MWSIEVPVGAAATPPLGETVRIVLAIVLISVGGVLCSAGLLALINIDPEDEDSQGTTCGTGSRVSSSSD